MYSLINEPDSFLEKIQKQRREYRQKIDEIATNAVEKLNASMIYDDINVLNADIKFVMDVITRNAQKLDGIKISLQIDDTNDMPGIQLLFKQWNSFIKSDPIQQNDIWVKGFNKYVSRTCVILTAALSEKTGIPIENEYRKAPAGIWLNFNKQRWLTIWWC